MNINCTTININYPSSIVAIVYSNDTANFIYFLCKDQFLIRMDTNTKETEKITSLNLTNIDFDQPISIQLSPSDTMISIVNTNGRYGYVYDLNKKGIVLNLDRKAYQINHSTFPVNFIQLNNQDYLVHASEWNHLDLYDFTLNKNITQRDSNKHGESQYLDYFYSQLHVSPKASWILSSGWVWHPVSGLKFIDLNSWLNSSINEPERSNGADFSICSYYWDRALCWVDDNTIAYLYDPREEDLDEAERKDLQFDIDTSYIIIYDVQNSKIKQKIIFSGFSQNTCFEPTPDCRIYYNGSLIISSQKNGTYVLNLKSGEIILENSNTILDQYNSNNDVFYRITDNNSIELTKINS